MNIYIEECGNDTNGDGSKNSPFGTLAKGLSAASDGDSIYIGSGIFKAYALCDLTKTNTNVIFIGKGQNTTIEIQYCYTNASFKCSSEFRNIIFRPSNSLSGDTRALSYTNDSYKIIFFNCLFLKSVNNSYPTSTYFYSHNNNNNFQSNKTFKNCTFVGIGSVCDCGASIFEKCITTGSKFQANTSYITESYTGCVLNNKYESNLIDIGYNVSQCLFFDDSKNKYFTIKNNTIVPMDKYDINESFNFQEIRTIKNINVLKYLKLIFTTWNDKLNNITILNNMPILSCILINLSEANIDTINFSSKFKFIVSNDLLNWNVYYDSKNYDTIETKEYDINFLKTCIKNRCRLLKEIHKKYNYILILLDKEIKTLYSEKKVNYKLSDIALTLTDEKILYISNTDTNIDINKLSISQPTISSLEEFK